MIDKRAFDSITGYIDRAAANPDCDIITGGTYDDSKGYFIQPTTIVCSDPRSETMAEEIFGPVLSVHVYADEDFEATLELCDTTSEYALTGSIFATDRRHIETASAALRYSAGNFYINDKPTGAVVGQQPFGGARGSGTNDKAGSPLNLLRWVSPRSSRRRSTRLTTGPTASPSDESSRIVVRRLGFSLHASFVRSFRLRNDVSGGYRAETSRDEVPPDRQQRCGQHQGQTCGHHEDAFGGLPRPHGAQAGADRKKPTSGITRRGHALVVFAGASTAATHDMAGNPIGVFFNGRFFFKPLMKENKPAPTTCNDEGLCRMLYFSDD